MPLLESKMMPVSLRRSFPRLCVVLALIGVPGAVHAQPAASRAHATLLVGGGVSENIAAPGAGLSVAARLRQWSRARMEVELGGLGFATVNEVCSLGSPICDNRHLSGAAFGSALLVVGPGGGPTGRGAYALVGVGPYSAWGIGCQSGGRGCEEGIRTLGLQGSVGAGARVEIGGRLWLVGGRALTLERATGRRGVVTLLQMGPTF